MGIIKRQSLKSSMVNYVGVGLGALFFIAIFPNIISKEYLGFIQLILGMTLVFAQLVCLGTANILYKYYAQWRGTSKLNEFNSLSLLIIIAASVVFSFLFIIFKAPIIDFFTRGKDSVLVDNFFWMVLPLVFIQSISYYFETYSSMSQRVTVPTFLREVVNRVLLIVTVFLLAYHLISDAIFVLIYILIYLFSLVVLSFYAIRFFKFGFGNPMDFFTHNLLLKNQSSYGRNTLAISFISALHNFIDTLMLPAFLGIGALGIYARPLILGQMISVPYRSISSISSPIIMEAWGRNDIEKVADLNKKLSVNLFLIGLFLFCLIVVNTDNFFNILPPEYAIAKSVLVIIAFGRMVDMSFGLNTEILISSKYYKNIVYFTLGMLCIAIILNVVLIPLIGMTGAAISVAFSLIAFNIMKAIFIYQKFNFHCYSKPYVPLILITIITIFITYFLVPDISSPTFNNILNTPLASVLLNVIFKSSVATLLFLGPILYLKINPDLNDFVRLIISGKIFKGGHKMDEL